MLAAGKTPVSWNFTTMPSEEWKNGVGSALTAYAAGTGDWDGVVTALWTAGPASTLWPTADPPQQPILQLSAGGRA